MRTTTLLLPLLAILGCDNKGTVNLDDSPVDDSAVEGDSDTDSDSDTDTDTDADGDTDLTVLTFDIDGEIDGSAMELTWFLPGDNGLVLGDTLVSAPVTANPFGLGTPDPASDQLVELDPTNAPGFFAALYIASMHEDPDGDHVHQDEPYLGVSPVWMFFADGTIPEGYLQIGIRHGWNALLPDLVNDSNPPTVLSIDDIPIATSLAPVDSVRISGTYDGDLDISLLRHALLPFVAFEGQDPGALLFDSTLSAEWTIEVSGEPPAAHIVSGGELDGVALEVPLTYSDNDGSHSFSTGDTPAYATCLNDLPVALWYYPQPTDLTTAAVASWYGFATGWAAFTVDSNDNFSFLSPEQSAALSVSGACSLE